MSSAGPESGNRNCSRTVQNRQLNASNSLLCPFAALKSPYEEQLVEQSRGNAARVGRGLLGAGVGAAGRG